MRRKSTITGYAVPFLKWAGGKTQLLPEILPRLPDRMRTYYEPFIGGGAVFFALANERRFERAVIGDMNPALTELYSTIRDQVSALITTLEAHQQHATDADYYYAMRGADTTRMTPLERSARTLFLNKTCFNGLYRVNRKGEFNVPFGKYANPKVCNADVLTAASQALQGVEIVNANFHVIAERAQKGDCVYFDPPYVPLSSTSSFCSYDQNAFGPKQHQHLADVYRGCLARGASAVLSNSDCPETRALFRGLDVVTVHATRAINSNATRRGTVTEILVAGPSRDRMPAVQHPRTAARVRTTKAA
ncbi:DNA adenine methylase [Myxococcota bacterium]|nr:DNA adenine methylase [Myxococcota bacterium]